MGEVEDRFWSTVRAVLIGCVAALVQVFLGVALGAGGHGWVTAFYFSLVSLVLFPIAVPLAFARPSAGWLVAAITIMALLIVADVGLCLMTVSELDYFRKVTHDDPGFVAFWFLLWAGGHVAALIGGYRQIAHRRSAPFPEPPATH